MRGPGSASGGAGGFACGSDLSDRSCMGVQTKDAQNAVVVHGASSLCLFWIEGTRMRGQDTTLSASAGQQ